MATNDTTSGEEATLFADQSAPAPSADAAPAAEAAPAPRRRASRRVTKKASAPAASADPQPVADAQTAGEGADAPVENAEKVVDVEDGEDVQAKRPARKRAVRKKAESAQGPATAGRARRGVRSKADRASEAVEELVADVRAGAEDTAPEAEAQTPAEASAEGRDGAALVDLEATVEAGSHRQEQQDHSDAEADAGARSAELAETDESDETDQSVESDETDAEETEAPRVVVPSFSVLFQAPDASKAVPTRRRRSARAEEQVEEPGDRDDERGLADDEPTGTEERSQQPGEELDEESSPRRSRRRRGGKGRRGRGNDEEELQEQTSEDGEAGDARPSGDSRGADADTEGDADQDSDADTDSEDGAGSSRRRRRRRRAGSAADSAEDTPNVSVRVRQPRPQNDEPVAVKGSTRLEAKKQRRREGREAGRRRTIITEAEFLARREAVDRVMVVRNKDGRTQMGVLEDGVLVEHYIDQATTVSMAGNIYLGRVQNVLPSMEAAFVDIGKGRNAVLYAGEVNWDAAGLEANQPKRIENALSSGQTVLVQVTKDPIGHKGARLTSQISLPGRYLVYVPNSSMTGISRKLPDTERARLKKILREVVPESAGVIVRTAAEGASEEELRADVERLTRTWEDIQAKAEAASSPRAGKSKGKKKNGGSGSVSGAQAPMLLHGEPDLTVRVIRDVFNEDFKQLVVAGEQAWNEIHPYISSVAPDLADRVTKWTSEEDLFTHHRVDEQLAKAMDRKVWLPSGGSLVIDFIDMVLESNRELVVRRLLECLGRDRTKHQVAEVTSLGLVQMTRKRVGSGLIEVFSETCEHCNGRGFIIHTEPVDKGAHSHEAVQQASGSSSRRRGRGQSGNGQGGNGQGANGTGGQSASTSPSAPAAGESKNNGPTAAQIAAAAHAAALKSASGQPVGEAAAEAVAEVQAQAQSDAQVGTRSGRQSGPQSGPRSGHAFPEDTGPWSGDDAHASDPGDGQATQGGTHVELESDDAAPAGAEPTPEVAVETTGSVPVEAAVEVQPAARGRRRRGRVVAPAGPPRAHAGSGADDGAAQGS